MRHERIPETEDDGLELYVQAEDMLVLGTRALIGMGRG